MAMKLPGLFSSQEPSIPERFFLIYFGEHTVRAGLWQVQDQKLDLLTTSTPQPWKEESALVDATDHALQQLGKDSEQVKQTLFALEPTWVNQQGILADKKTVFQNLTKELSLEAVGFVVIPEAIIQYQLNRKGTSLQCFVIEVLAERVSMTIVKNGKLGQQEMVGRSQNVVDDIKEGFARFQDGSLPSLVFLYSAFLTPEELDEARQRLLELDLLTDNTFMQQPTFEVITDEQIIEIILQTGGRAVAEAKHLLDPAQPVMVDATASPALAAEESVSEESLPSDEELAVDSSVLPPASPTRKGLPESATGMNTTSFDEQEHDEFPAVAQQSGRKGLKIPHHPVLFGVIGVVLGLLLLAVVFLLSSGQVMSAVVDVQLKSQPVTKQLALKLDPTANVSDPNTGILKAEVVKQVVSGQKTGEATGKKIIGDKAKGKVTLYNRTSSPKTFEAGTTLTGGGKQFVLDKAETVASASTGSNFETRPGTLEATITAVDIGSESNIAKDVEMTIGTFSTDTYVAKTTDAAAGGTSREIKALSQKDLDDLAAALKKELNEQAVKQLQDQAGSGRYIFPTNRLRVVSTKFSDEVGKETNTFSVEMDVEAEAVSYSAQELKSLASQVVASSVPEGYTVAEDQIELLTEPVSAATSSAQVSINTNITAKARPQAKPEEWEAEILGVDEQAALAILKGKPEVESATISLQPAFFARILSKVPKDAAKVEMKLR